MKDQISMTNVSFDYLRNSPNFLNLVLNNISSCVLLLNRNMELHAFNDALKTIFSARKDENLLYVRCGEAIGCAYNVDEMKNCGETSRCASCQLRESALISYSEDKAVYKRKISREFYMHDGKKVMKHLQFSTRCFRFEKDKYIILIIDDITELVNTKTMLTKKEQRIKELESER